MRHKIEFDALSDMELVALAHDRDAGAIRTITTRNNQRLFRTAWSVLRNRADAEDAVQEAYLKAFTSLASFTGTASLSTWLTRITLNTALDRQRAAARRQTDLIRQDITMLDEYRRRYAGDGGAPPSDVLAKRELGSLLKSAIADLPDDYRTVFVLREVEGMSVRETADALNLTEAVVKTRLLRARRTLRKALATDIQALMGDSLSFAGADCEKMPAGILSGLGLQPPP